MNTRSYKLIFILLSVSVTSILGLQAYWLRNHYVQKTEEFDRSVYDALEEIGIKLRDRKNLESLKMTYFIQNGDTVAKTPSQNKIIIEAEDHLQVKTKAVTSFQVKQVRRISQKRTSNEPVLISTNSNGNTSIVFGGSHAQVFASSKTSKQSKPEQEAKESEYIISSDEELPDVSDNASFPNLDSLLLLAHANDSLKRVTKPRVNKQVKELMNKVMTEIIVLDTETRNKDTVSALIKNSLNNRGLFLPFEFSMRKELKTGKVDTLSQSEGFDEALRYFKSDLTGSNIIPTREWIYLQFNTKSDYVMAGMQSSIVLSLLFSLLIVSIFYYVMRLIRKQKKLSDIKNDFINNMTHELKTPIATISLAVDAMNNPEIKNDVQRSGDYSRILKEETHKLNTHVERVLQMALLDKGELFLQKEKLDLIDLLKETVRNYQLQIMEKEAEVKLESPKALSFIGDRNHLLGLFSNLLDNALKYSATGKTVIIEVKENKSVIEISFKDQGIGMNEEQQKKIFDKFYRAQGGNLHDVKGFGLGLSYVKSIVEAHGGSIGVKSSPGRGSEFIIRFIINSL